MNLNLGGKVSEHELPWQVTPSRLIRFAIEQSSKNTDFDKQISYLILDVGVETIFKVFLKQHGYKELKKAQSQKDGRELSFHDIIALVKLVAGEKLQNIKVEYANHYHEKRNEIYHQGVSFPPLQDDLDGYLELAKTLLKVLLDVDIDKWREQEKNSDVQHPYYPPYELSSLFGTLQDTVGSNIDSLQFYSSLLVEYLYPQIATRKFAAQLRYIRIDTGPDDESYSPSLRADMVKQRIDAFNKITGWEFSDQDKEDYEFVEYIIDNPNQLHVWLAFQEIGGDDWVEDWKKYKSVVDLLHRKTEDKRYEEVLDWTYKKAEIIFKWVKERITDIDLNGPAKP